MTKLADEAGAINLAQGLGELPTFEPAVVGAIEAMQAQQNRYSYPEGIPSLRKAILEKMAADQGISDPSLDVLVSSGSIGAFTTLCMTFFEAGDEVIIPEPYYSYHPMAVSLAGATPIFCPTEPPSFDITIEALDRVLSPKTKAILLCNPSNPSGKVFTEQELSRLAEWIRKKDLFAITDEIYEYILFDGQRHRCLASFPGMAERTFTISGFSKSFSMTGWRIGYVVGPREWLQRATIVNDSIYICAPTPLQHGVAKAWNRFDENERKKLAQTFQKKRDLLIAALKKTSLKPIRPSGSYYLLADVSSLRSPSSEEAALRILKEAGVATVTGSAFFSSPMKERFVRFCFAKSDQDLEAAGRQLIKVFSA